MEDTVTPEIVEPATEARPWNAINCSCGAWWTGLGRAHCAAAGCHRTFSTDGAADKHRVGKHGIDRRCVDPAEVGLVAVTKPYGVLWQHPGPEGGMAAARHQGPSGEDLTVYGERI